MNRKALVIDDDPLSREFLVEALETSGYRVVQAPDGEEGMQHLRSRDLDLVITDLRLPGMDGIEVVCRTKDALPDIPVVVLTAYGSVSTAVEAMRSGAEDFLLKPVSPEQLEVVLARTESMCELKRENKVLKARLEPSSPRKGVLIGENSRLMATVALAERVAATNATVLIRGESGSGKELIAILLHEQSKRSQGPFIQVNCAALTESLLTSELFGHEKGSFTGAIARKEGRFELAQGGTLFLDEIGEIPLEVQAKLLRVLETGDFERVGGTATLRADVRIVAATNRNLEQAISEGRFREDLYYRLNVVPVNLPPLRERLDDISLLAAHFLRRYRREHGGPVMELSTSALATLRSAEWPGNVRELANCIQRAVIVCNGPVIEPVHLGLPDAEKLEDKAIPVGMTLEELERKVILKALDLTDWNRTRAAESLGVTARTLSNKLKTWRTRGLLSADGRR